ncbi:hypothetical protein [Nocardia paucivorans]|uniref:hypothetical protein n=1 Tax=Nocardia paucivorans TaxID=114259 RepID=UPI0002D9C55C|nr:hypothetical protein [Nocardia paucivorans]
MSTGESGKTRATIVLVALLLACGCCLFGPFAALGNEFSHGATDYRNQCEAALGPDPSVTVTPTTTPDDPEPMSAPSSTVLPSTNPYAAVILDPDDPNVTDRDLACISAMRYAPYQGAGILRQPNTGVAVECARQLGMQYLENGTGDAVMMARDLIYAASTAPLSNQCIVLRAPTDSSTTPSECGNPTDSMEAVLLPVTVERQGYCGLRVATSAVSPGDLVFWEYGRDGAGRVGVAIGAREMVTGEPGGDGLVRMSIPERRDVLIKRVLGGGR